MKLSLAAFLTITRLAASQISGHGRPYAGCSDVPDTVKFVNETYILPDPFHFLDRHAVRTEKGWSCRAAQLRTLFQRYELGDKPLRPPVLTSTSNSSTITITAGLANGQSIDIPVTVTYPQNGTAPYPAIIAYDALSIPAPPGAAILLLPVSIIAQQNNLSSRGVGTYYDLYGSNATAGALMAWAWAVSRVIDMIEEHPDYKINPERIAVTGCSRNGKGAMVAGAFDERVVLTIPQESGSGGDACWRTSRDMLVNRGLYTQTASEIITENVWFSLAFDQFGASNYTIGLLPFDHHELAGLVAPRGLYSTENVESLWLGDWSNLECMTAANKIYQALGAQHNQGFSQDGPHDHCSFPSDQVSEIDAFFDRFLFDRDVDPYVFRTVGNWTFDPRWTPWQVPQLVPWAA